MTGDRELFARRLDAINERVWRAFDAEEFVVQVDPSMESLIIIEPRHEEHRMAVEFASALAVRDWDDLLDGVLRPRIAQSEEDAVVSEISARLWDAAMIAPAYVDRLVYRHGYFDGVANPLKLPPRLPPGDGPLKWET
ncbi:hypothetical protein [Leifsonia sp. 71-9]|uniref:hypothetical protein n=1 Tax=Leifsonia sp. 71-9 TaxID=1895934 RepID=UPI0025BD15D7|nr:hypothetical protein [Leifsonia sp. 71-9]